MSVEIVLDKIVAQNPAVHGCIFRVGETLHHNLQAPYDIVDIDEIADHSENLLSVTEMLDDANLAFDTAFVEYERHSIVAKRAEGNLLVLVAEPIQRNGFKKLQIGLGLFMKPLAKAANESLVAQTVDAPAREPEGAPLVLKADRRDAAPVVEPLAEDVKDPPAAASPETASPPPGKKKRVYRGVVFWE